MSPLGRYLVIMDGYTLSIFDLNLKGVEKVFDKELDYEYDRIEFTKNCKYWCNGQN